MNPVEFMCLFNKMVNVLICTEMKSTSDNLYNPDHIYVKKIKVSTILTII